eukprot:gb/GEZJ01001444.1/.p3 GENE.gb/GEZJ01001444.1/~~gb/GEZJ01001444.1/.p3  ORF type:complete len:106 (-),score=5.85 gb/GEZJ01001444.1/:648-965(-)
MHMILPRMMKLSHLLHSWRRLLETQNVVKFINAIVQLASYPCGPGWSVIKKPTSTGTKAADHERVFARTSDRCLPWIFPRTKNSKRTAEQSFTRMVFSKEIRFLG